MFKVGVDPSSSHAVGPVKAGKQFVDDLVEKGSLNGVARVTVDAYGPLLLTGEGHHAGIAIITGLVGNEPVTVDIDSISGFVHDVEKRERLLLVQERHEVDFPHDDGMRSHNGDLPLHGNGIQVHTYNDDKAAYSKTYYPIGGGFIADEGHFGQNAANEVSVPYPFKSATGLPAYCNEISYSLPGLVMQNELALHSKKEIDEYFTHVWQTTQAHIDHGMNTEGVLLGPLRVSRCASALRRILVSSDKLFNDLMNVTDWVNMFVLAANEEDAADGRMVIASINDACGIVPAVLAYYDHFIGSVSPDIYTRYFVAAGAIGALYKVNASISGTEVGCQGEVGAACSMAAAGLAELLGGSPEQVCVTAETNMEHDLGLTCDSVAGRVQMPCIERNATAPAKAVNAAWMTLHHTSVPRVPLGKVIKTIYETGKDMNAKYHETSCDSLAVKVQCD